MEPDDLKSKLQAWRVSLEIPSRFQTEVWQRIASHEKVRRRSAWNRVREGLLIQLARPQYATALIAVSISVSLGLAYLQAREANEKYRRELETRYENSIDPFAAPST